MTHDKNAVRKILEQAKASGHGALTAPEAPGPCAADAHPRLLAQAHHAAEGIRAAHLYQHGKYRWRGAPVSYPRGEHRTGKDRVFAQGFLR